MNKEMYCDFCTKLLGTKGTYWYEIGPINEIVCDYIYVDYYQERQLSSREVILGYIGGYKQLSPKIAKHYIGERGRRYLRRNMFNLLRQSLSRYKIICICEQVHYWLASTNLSNQAPDISNYYTSQLTLGEAALYLGDVLHFVMYIT